MLKRPSFLDELPKKKIDETDASSTTCGGGSQKRTRECRPASDSGPASKLFCLGESVESRVRFCNSVTKLIA